VSGRGKTLCIACGAQPTAFPRVKHCFGCWPTGPVTAPPCYQCGSRTQYFVGGLCHRCHRDGHPGVDSCRNCLAWGAKRLNTWYCMGCRSWIRKYTTVADCVVCTRRSHLDDASVCKLCRKQASYYRRPHELVDLIAANRHGQQLFLADMFIQRDRTQPANEPAARPVIEAIPPAARGARQLLLLEMPRDLSRRGYSIAGLAERANETIAAELDQIVGDFGRARGWRRDLIWEVRLGIRILIGFQEQPGDPITASDVTALTGTEIPVNRVLAVLDHAGLLVDDRTQAIDRFFDRQLTELPEPMRSELSRWFTIMRDGSATAPRSRPRSSITIEIYTRAALPALREWVRGDHTSLREISRDDIRVILPPAGPPRFAMAQALRSIFTILKAHKVVFTNPMAHIKTGYQPPKPPLPLIPELLRAALDSPDPARAAVVALVAYHALHHHQIRDLKLTDIRDGRVHFDDGRAVPLAQPVLDRINTYIDYRNRHWPRTANPHLFINSRSAAALNPPGYRWVHLKLDIPGGVTAIRADRILDEAEATGGDIRRITAMFQMSVTAAERYAYAVDDTDLINKANRRNQPRGT